jgi:hypothetical protein
MLMPTAIRRRPILLLAVFGMSAASLTAAARPPSQPPSAIGPSIPARMPMSTPMGRRPMGHLAGHPGGLAGRFNGGFHSGPQRYYGPGERRFFGPGAAQAQFAVASIPGRIGMIVAPVMLNGHGPFRFMIDTGATRTVLADSTLAKLNLSADPTAMIIVRGVSGRSVVPIVHVASVDSGSMHFHDLSAPVLSGPVLSGLDGILGMDGLRGMTVSADFVHDQVVIGASSAADSNSMYALRGQFVSQRLLMVPGRIGGVLTEAVIDTGAAHSLGNAALLALLTHGRASSATRTRVNGVVDATQTVQNGTLRSIPSMQLGVATLNNLSVTFGDFPVFKIWGLEGRPALLLGMDVLGTLADFSINYGKAELLVLPWPSAAG